MLMFLGYKHSLQILRDEFEVYAELYIENTDEVRK